jgi:hypothetical protein
MDPQAYSELRANREYRILLDETGPLPASFRHVGLRTPQGFDPMLTRRYQDLVQRHGKFRTDREFDLDPNDEEGLRLFGVGYAVTAASGRLYAELATSSRFRLVGSDEYYYKVFEFFGREPPFGWASREGGNVAKSLGSTAEAREFLVRSDRGDLFALHEQFYPGWTAQVDDAPATVELWGDAFQAIRVPAGEHRVKFVFQSRWLRIGAWISLVSAACIALFLWRSRRSDAFARVGKNF